MEMLSGSQISSFLSATSLVWASSIVLLMIGLVFFIKYKERHDSISNSRFLVLYILTIVLNALEYVMNIVMEKNPPYEVYVYKLYILLGLMLNIAIIFYVIYYIRQENSSKFSILKIANVALIVGALLCCIFLDVKATLEFSGKFYVLDGPLNDFYSYISTATMIIFLIVTICFKKKMPKGFFLLYLLTFIIYISILLFKNATGYTTKDTIFVYTLLVLVIFNTTSNQDRELVNKLNSKRNDLLNIYNRRNKFTNKISYQMGQSLNNLVLYNDDLYLSNELNRNLIQTNSIEIDSNTNQLKSYLNNIKDIYMAEANNIVNYEYQLKMLTNNINAYISPLAISKRIDFNISVDEPKVLNYIGDFKAIEKALINILYNAVNNTDEGKEINLIISSKQQDLRNVELSFVISNNGTTNADAAQLNINDFVDTNREFNDYNLKMIVSRRLIELLNSKIDVKTENNNTTYSFAIIQGFKAII